MRLSIHGRLTVWYSAAVFVALTVCGLVVYTAVVNLEMASLDDDLRRAASTAAFSMAFEAKQGHDLQAAASDTETELSITDVALGLFDTRGRLLAARWQGFEPIQTIRAAEVGAPHTIKLRDVEWRRLVTRHSFAGSDYLVLSAARLDPVRTHTARIRSILLAIIPVTIAIAALGGWLTARSTLRPISRLAAEADHLSHDHPTVRLSVPDGKDELTSLATAFNALLERLQTAIDAQRQFMADASHELRTPVSVIRSAADVTRSRPHRSADEYVDTIDVIAEQARRLSRLVDDLFLLSRADVKATPMATSRFYVDDVLADCVRAASVLGRSKAIRFEMSGASDLEIEGDEDLMRRMLMNLMENAVRYNDKGTEVRVTLSRHGSDAEIAIADDGKGIPRQDRARIFERFVRLDPKSSSGAGLGLPIARWIAEAHRGSLILADTAGGTTFIVRLPLQVDILAAEVT